MNLTPPELPSHPDSQPSPSPKPDSRPLKTQINPLFGILAPATKPQSDTNSVMKEDSISSNRNPMAGLLSGVFAQNQSATPQIPDRKLLTQKQIETLKKNQMAQLLQRSKKRSEEIKRLKDNQPIYQEQKLECSEQGMLKIQNGQQQFLCQILLQRKANFDAVEDPNKVCQLNIINDEIRLLTGRSKIRIIFTFLINLMMIIMMVLNSNRTQLFEQQETILRPFSEPYAGNFDEAINDTIDLESTVFFMEKLLEMIMRQDTPRPDESSPEFRLAIDTSTTKMVNRMFFRNFNMVLAGKLNIDSGNFKQQIILDSTLDQVLNFRGIQKKLDGWIDHIVKNSTGISSIVHFQIAFLNIMTNTTSVFDMVVEKSEQKGLVKIYDILSYRDDYLSHPDQRIKFIASIIVYCLSLIFFLVDAISTLIELFRAISIQRNIVGPLIRLIIVMFNLGVILTIIVTNYINSTGNQFKLFDKNSNFFQKRAKEIELCKLLQSLSILTHGYAVVVAFNEYFLYSMAPIVWAYSKDSTILVLIFGLKGIIILTWLLLRSSVLVIINHKYASFLNNLIRDIMLIFYGQPTANDMEFKPKTGYIELVINGCEMIMFHFSVFMIFCLISQRYKLIKKKYYDSLLVFKKLTSSSHQRFIRLTFKLICCQASKEQQDLKMKEILNSNMGNLIYQYKNSYDSKDKVSKQMGINYKIVEKETHALVHQYIEDLSQPRTYNLFILLVKLFLFGSILFIYSLSVGLENQSLSISSLDASFDERSVDHIKNAGMDLERLRGSLPYVLETYKRHLEKIKLANYENKYSLSSFFPMTKNLGITSIRQFKTSFTTIQDPNDRNFLSVFAKRDVEEVYPSQDSSNLKDIFFIGKFTNDKYEIQRKEVPYDIRSYIPTYSCLDPQLVKELKKRNEINYYYQRICLNTQISILGEKEADDANLNDIFKNDKFLSIDLANMILAISMFNPENNYFGISLAQHTMKISGRIDSNNNHILIHKSFFELTWNNLGPMIFLVIAILVNLIRLYDYLTKSFEIIKNFIMEGLERLDELAFNNDDETGEQANIIEETIYFWKDLVFVVLSTLFWKKLKEFFLLAIMVFQIVILQSCIKWINMAIDFPLVDYEDIFMNSSVQERELNEKAIDIGEAIHEFRVLFAYFLIFEFFYEIFYDILDLRMYKNIKALLKITMDEIILITMLVVLIGFVVASQLFVRDGQWSGSLSDFTKAMVETIIQQSYINPFKTQIEVALVVLVFIFQGFIFYFLVPSMVYGILNYMNFIMSYINKSVQQTKNFKETYKDVSYDSIFVKVLKDVKDKFMKCFERDKPDDDQKEDLKSKDQGSKNGSAINSDRKERKIVTTLLGGGMAQKAKQPLFNTDTLNTEQDGLVDNEVQRKLAFGEDEAKNDGQKIDQEADQRNFEGEDQQIEEIKQPQIRSQFSQLFKGESQVNHLQIPSQKPNLSLKPESMNSIQPNSINNESEVKEAPSQNNFKGLQNYINKDDQKKEKEYDPSKVDDASEDIEEGIRPVKVSKSISSKSKRNQGIELHELSLKESQNQSQNFGNQEPKTPVWNRSLQLKNKQQSDFSEVEIQSPGNFGLSKSKNDEFGKFLEGSQVHNTKGLNQPSHQISEVGNLSPVRRHKSDNSKNGDFNISFFKDPNENSFNQKQPESIKLLSLNQSVASNELQELKNPNQAGKNQRNIERMKSIAEEQEENTPQNKIGKQPNTFTNQIQRVEHCEYSLEGINEDYNDEQDESDQIEQNFQVDNLKFGKIKPTFEYETNQKMSKRRKQIKIEQEGEEDEDAELDDIDEAQQSFNDEANSQDKIEDSADYQDDDSSSHQSPKKPNLESPNLLGNIMIQNMETSKLYREMMEDSKIIMENFLETMLSKRNMRISFQSIFFDCMHQNKIATQLKQAYNEKENNFQNICFSKAQTDNFEAKLQEILIYNLGLDLGNDKDCIIKQKDKIQKKIDRGERLTIKTMKYITTQIDELSPNNYRDFIENMQLLLFIFIKVSRQKSTSFEMPWFDSISERMLFTNDRSILSEYFNSFTDYIVFLKVTDSNMMANIISKLWQHISQENQKLDFWVAIFEGQQAQSAKKQKEQFKSSAKQQIEFKHVFRMILWRCLSTVYQSQADKDKQLKRKISGVKPLTNQMTIVDQGNPEKQKSSSGEGSGSSADPYIKVKFIDQASNQGEVKVLNYQEVNKDDNLKNDQDRDDLNEQKNDKEIDAALPLLRRQRQKRVTAIFETAEQQKQNKKSKKFSLFERKQLKEKHFEGKETNTELGFLSNFLNNNFLKAHREDILKPISSRSKREAVVDLQKELLQINRGIPERVIYFLIIPLKEKMNFIQSLNFSVDLNKAYLDLIAAECTLAQELHVEELIDLGPENQENSVGLQIDQENGLSDFTYRINTSVVQSLKDIENSLNEKIQDYEEKLGIKYKPHQYNNNEVIMEEDEEQDISIELNQ